MNSLPRGPWHSLETSANRALGQFFNVKFHLFWINKLCTWIFQKPILHIITFAQFFCDWVGEQRYLDHKEWRLCWLMKVWPVHVEHWAATELLSSPEVTSTKPKRQTKASGAFTGLIQGLSKIKAHCEWNGNIFLSGSSMDMLYTFANCSGLDLIFGLNALLRTRDLHWDSSNAQLLLDYCASKNYNISWELGNGKYPPIPGTFHS